MSLTSPQLWVVATPLGNHGDFSERAREVVSSVDMVLAEDTRRTGLLFQRCDVTARRFISLHDHNEEAKTPEILAMLAAGQTAALLSDAGMPLCADPGFRLVKACRDAGIRVSVVPGPSAPLTALAASGIAPLPYTFVGFPPRKRSDQERLFASFATLQSTLIFFERKDRLLETLEVAHAVLGSRELCVARELTKTHEEYIYGRLENYTDISPELLGEITVVIGPPEGSQKSSQAEILALIAEEESNGACNEGATALRPKEIARRVQLRATAWTVKEIYSLLRH